MSLSDALLKVGGKKDDVIKILRDLITKTNIETKTELDKTKIMVIAKARIIADITKDRFNSNDSSKLIRDACINLMILMLSHDRKSREEVADILKAFLSFEGEAKSADMFKKMFSG